MYCVNRMNEVIRKLMSRVVVCRWRVKFEDNSGDEYNAAG